MGSSNASKRWSAWASVAALLFLLPTLHSSWLNGDPTGVAAQTWAFGVPLSPWVSLSRNGSGPLQAIDWQPYRVQLHWRSWSWLVLGGALTIQGLHRRRLRRSPLPSPTTSAS